MNPKVLLITRAQSYKVIEKPESSTVIVEVEPQLRANEADTLAALRRMNILATFIGLEVQFKLEGHP